jgi:hypothetical protein
MLCTAIVFVGLVKTAMGKVLDRVMSPLSALRLTSRIRGERGHRVGLVLLKMG